MVWSRLLSLLMSGHRALALMSRVEEDAVPAHMVHLFPVRLLET